MTKRADAARIPTLIPILILSMSGCQAAEETPEPAPAESVESVSAGVRITALPDVFDVAGNDSDALRLTASSLPGPNSVTITLSDEYPSGLNILDAVKQEMSNFEALPEGRSFGQTQLVAPIGLTYMARGRYERDGAQVEELKAMLAHPWGNRLLAVAYAYPAGTDTSERGAQLMELLGEMEAIEEVEDAEL